MRENDITEVVRGVYKVTCTQFLVHSLCEFNATCGSAVSLEVSRRLAGSDTTFGKFSRGQYGKLRIAAKKLGEPSWLSHFFRGSHRIFSSALAFHVSITISLVCKLSGLSGQSEVKPIMAGQVIHQSHCFFVYNYIVIGPWNP